MDKYIDVVLKEIDKYLRSECDCNEEVLLFSNYFHNFGNVDKQRDNIIVNIADINVKNDLGSNIPRYIKNGENFVVKKTPLQMYIHLFFLSHYSNSNALEGIRILSCIAGFLKENIHFSSKQIPEMNKRKMNDFNIVLENDDDKLFSKLMIPYMPSLLYKIGPIQVCGQTYSNTVVVPIKNV